MFIFYFAFPVVALFPSSKVSSSFGLESHTTGNTFFNFISELIIFHMNERLQDLCPRLIRKRMLMIRKINYKQARVTSDSSSPLLRYFHSWQNMEIPEKECSENIFSSLYSLIEIHLLHFHQSVQYFSFSASSLASSTNAFVMFCIVFN